MTAHPRITIDGPTLLFGGPYGNLQATEAVLAEARRRAIPARRIVCTGDVVAYCGDPVATIALLRDAGIHVVGGNCDEQIGASADDCGCGFEEGTACDRLSAAWYAAVDRAVGVEDRRWLAALPERIDLVVGTRHLAVVHGSMTAINQFVFPTTALAEKRRHLALASAEGCDGIVGGHSGLPFTQVIDGRLWHNPGVAGMPANDGTPRVWASVLTPHAAGALEIEHLALSYDHAGASAAMARGGSPVEYRDALASGRWPSLDVLPAFERTMTGRPLTAQTVVWPFPAGGSSAAALGALWPNWLPDAAGAGDQSCSVTADALPPRERRRAT